MNEFNEGRMNKKEEKAVNELADEILSELKPKKKTPMERIAHSAGFWGSLIICLTGLIFVIRFALWFSKLLFELIFMSW